MISAVIKIKDCFSFVERIDNFGHYIGNAKNVLILKSMTSNF